MLECRSEWVFFFFLAKSEISREKLFLVLLSFSLAPLFDGVFTFHFFRFRFFISSYFFRAGAEGGEGEGKGNERESSISSLKFIEL